jgi:hypothetical protein
LSKVYFYVNDQANNGVGSMQGLTMKSLKHHVALQPLFVIIGAGMVFVGAYVFRSASQSTALTGFLMVSQLRYQVNWWPLPV